LTWEAPGNALAAIGCQLSANPLSLEGYAFTHSKRSRGIAEPEPVKTIERRNRVSDQWFLLSLSLYIFGEHFFGIDGDEDTAAAREHFVLFVEDFGGVDVGASSLLDLAPFDA
jgi:hypothetical protein